MSNLLERLYFEGCDVYAHDHTVKNFPSTKQLNLHLAKIGIGVSNNMTYKGQIKTLETILQENGHSERIISYLKATPRSWIWYTKFISSLRQITLQIDVEGAERDVMLHLLRRWLQLSNICDQGN